MKQLGSKREISGERRSSNTHNDTTGRIYMPTTQLEPVASGRPKPKPGTFMIVVVGH
jgi:hypothetical protein